MMSMTERAMVDARNDGLREGIERGIVIAVCGYIRNTGATIDEALDVHSIPDDVRGKIRGEIATRLSE